MIRLMVLKALHAILSSKWVVIALALVLGIGIAVLLAYAPPHRELDSRY